MALVLLFLLGPLLIAIAVAFSSGERIGFPPPGLSLRWFADALGNEQFRDAAARSLWVALAATVISVVAGTGAAVALTQGQGRFAGRAWVQAFIMLPLAIPGIVLGLALLPTAIMLGLRPGFWATVLGHAVVGIPYSAYLVLAAFAQYDPALDRASASLGVGPWRSFLRVTLPLIRPGIVSAAICTFLLSFDNVALSLFLSRGDTLPLRLMQHIQFTATPAVAAASVMLVLLSLGAMLMLGRVLRGRGTIRIAG
ncbi:ABC transporter permease [Roseococcus suduntuyensis]|uniref:Putative spermidine/putrescine transport system permease protein n=1 Tax=Roseococcus suduntuyensis TaxID=455361 RepID=A0A840ACX0_9PROT|nr:ABC transporter permease [Roseococcus suduntuyensis]MBB3898190.1 putative spermidine/putrescine transport system permease protein [Roseococcus suduntuyensis]